MKGLAFAVSLFHRLSAEAPSRSVSAVILDVEDFAARLVEAGKCIEGAFADDSTPTAPPAGKPLTPAELDQIAAIMKSSEVAPPRALVGGGRPAAEMDDASRTGPAPTPPAPGIAGVPAGK